MQFLHNFLPTENESWVPFSIAPATVSVYAVRAGTTSSTLLYRLATPLLSVLATLSDSYTKMEQVHNPALYRNFGRRWNQKQE